MPRRIPDYPKGYAFWNKIVSVGGYLTIFTAFIFLFIIFKMIRSKKKLDRLPWDVTKYHTEWYNMQKG